MYDFHEIKSSVKLSDEVSKRVDLKKDGKEYRGCCPFHNERTASFTVSDDSGFYHCFGCGAHGDVIDFVSQFDGVKPIVACEILGGKKQANIPKDRPQRESVKQDIYEGIVPNTTLPEDVRAIFQPKQRTKQIYNPKRETYATYTPEMVHVCRQLNGTIFGFVLRVNFNGKKVTFQTMACTNLPEGAKGGCLYPFAKAFDDAVPPYRGQELADSPDKPVLIVEGEKCADVAAPVLTDYVVISWHGGTNSVDKTDWTCLKGREVYAMPDNDDGGYKAVQKIKEILETNGTKVQTLPIRQDLPKGHDIADDIEGGWGQEEFNSWLGDHVDQSTTKPTPSQPLNRQIEDGPFSDMPFRQLGCGYDGRYSYFSKSSGTIHSFTASEHTEKNMFYLCARQYWVDYLASNNYADNENPFKIFKFKPEHVSVITDSLMQTANRLPSFDMHGGSVRSHGAWKDGDNVAINLGDKVVIGKEIYDNYEAPSEFIYEKCSPLGITPKNGMRQTEAAKLLEICNQITWGAESSGILLAGWITTSIICTMMNWRTHLFIFGDKNSGKSTVAKRIVGGALKGLQKDFAGNTTEAGIRQEIGNLGLSVRFDEAEGDSQRERDQQQAILDYFRLATDMSCVVKGSIGGTAQKFYARFQGLMLGVNPQLQRATDTTRFLKMEVVEDRRDDCAERYADLLKKCSDTFTDEWTGKFLMYVVNNIDTITHNEGVFKLAWMKTLPSARMADTLANPMSGYALLKDPGKKYTVKEAEQLLKTVKWEDYMPQNATARNSGDFMDYLMSQMINVENKRISIGKAVIMATKAKGGERYQDEFKAYERLLEIGIKVDVMSSNVFFHPRSENLRKVLRDTPWGAGYDRLIESRFKIEKRSQPVRFIAGTNPTRSIAVPLKEFTLGLV